MAATIKSIIEAEKIVSVYIASNYHWDKTQYEIIIDSKKSEEDIIYFFVLHYDDTKKSIRGAGKSILVEFDLSLMQVVREHGYQ